MKVRIVSGNQTGAVVEMGQSEAESAIGSGYAEVFTPAPATEAPAPAPQPAAAEPTEPTKKLAKPKDKEA